MKKSRKVLILLLCSVLGIGAVAGIAAAVRLTTGSTVLVVQAANFNYGGGWFSSGDTVSGVMTTNAEQTIYLTDAEEVAEVFVQQGQAVHAGDVLFTYDTKRTGMNLEKAKIDCDFIVVDDFATGGSSETYEAMILDKRALGFYPKPMSMEMIRNPKARTNEIYLTMEGTFAIDRFRNAVRIKAQ